MSDCQLFTEIKFFCDLFFYRYRPLLLGRLIWSAKYSWFLFTDGSTERGCRRTFCYRGVIIGESIVLCAYSCQLDKVYWTHETAKYSSTALLVQFSSAFHVLFVSFSVIMCRVTCLELARSITIVYCLLLIYDVKDLYIYKRRKRFDRSNQ